MGRKIVTIFTDGSADNRIADCGGCAAILRYGNSYKEITSGSWSSTTNNRMELLAIILGLENVKAGFKIELTTDSEVCLKWIDQLVRDEPSDAIIQVSKNADLLIRLNKSLIKHKGNVNFKWVRGHIGVEDNERCDVLAGQYAIKDNPTRDIGSGIGECPKLGWFLNESKKILYLGNSPFNGKFPLRDSSEKEYLSIARKMSKKEITQALKNRGWSNKKIKEYEIDTSYYKKPI
tara:strand:- start:702 stop:1403 length:702 start_codon:yes stop_codon:yes gene_type:complete